MSTAISETVSEMMVKPISLKTLQGSGVTVFASFHVAGNVLDHHDGVIHHKACGNGEGHQRQVIEREPKQVHRRHGAHQRKRYRQAGNDRGRNIAQEDEDDADNEQHGQTQLVFDIVNRGTDGCCPVCQWCDLDARGQVLLELGQDAQNVVHHANHVGAGLTLNIQDQGRGLVRPCRQLSVLCAFDDRSHIANADRAAVLIGNDLVHQLIDGLDLPINAQGRRALGAVKCARWGVDIHRCDDGPQGVDRDTV